VSLLIVDDTAGQRFLLAAILRAAGYNDLLMAGSAEQAFRLLGCDAPPQSAEEIDLVLMDISMPDMDGIEACRIIKAAPDFQDLPIIMVTASTESADLQLAFDAGANDFISKPFNRIELLARVRSALRLKHEMDKRKAREWELRAANEALSLKHRLLQEEQERSEQLLLNILPQPIAQELKHHKGIIAHSFDEVTVLFADIVDFTKLSASILPEELVILLNEVFSRFDRLAELHGLEKIKTIGDAYMAVGGLTNQRSDHAQAVAEMALDMRDEVARHYNELEIRIGIATGPVVAGVIGTKKFSYDLWGNTVNMASRMESHGFGSSIQVTERTFMALRDSYDFTRREDVWVKGHGKMRTYLLNKRRLVDYYDLESYANRT
jgi:adenylate cyclase